MHLQALLSAALAALPFTAALVALLVLERRLLGASSAIGVPSRSMAWLALAVLAAAAAAAAYGWWSARAVRPTDDAVAIELDARVRTGERFSTALALEADASAAADPFARAAIADAVRHASDPDVAARVREAFPVTAPARWWTGPAVLAAAVLLWATVPQLESARTTDADVRAAAAERVPTLEEKRLEDVVKQIEQSPELAAKLDAELDAARKAIDEGATGPVRTPEQAAREAMKRMAELQARLDEVSDSRESKELQDALAKLELPKDANAARELAEALKQGDFAAAKEALQSLQKQAAKDSGLSQEEREQLAKALEDTSKQLDALSKDPAKLAEALKQAGMDPSLANNPAALQEAMKQAAQLNQSQREQLQKMAESMQGAQSKLAQMSQEMQKSASQCRNPGQSQGQQSQGQQSQGQSGSEQQQASSQQSEGQDSSSSMSQMLSEAEADRQMAMAAEGAKSQCQGGGDGMSESEADSALRASAEGDGQSQGSGGRKDGNGGGRAQASGGDRSIRETAFGTKFQKQKGARGEGDVIARQLVAGQAPVGESRVALEEVAGTIATGYERGSEDDPVPAHLREVHKRYFGELRQKFAEKGVKPAAPGAAAPSAPPAPGPSNAK
jgi:hypothetical protein